MAPYFPSFLPTPTSGPDDSVDGLGGDDLEGDLDGDISDEYSGHDDSSPVLCEARVIELVDDNCSDLLVLKRLLISSVISQSTTSLSRCRHLQATQTAQIVIA